jgi:triose/dihydroxyacetone kinase / FAD-AMP lyase (cyclizing)
MAGISLSLMAVDEDRLRWLDAPTTAPAWPKGPRQRPPAFAQGPSRPVSGAFSVEVPPRVPPIVDRSAVGKAIAAACAALLEAEPRLTELDQAVGDGDLGVTLARGARAVQSALPTYPLSEVPATLQAIGRTLQANLGGASGPLYGVMFLRCGSALPSSRPFDLEQWAVALARVAEALTELGGANAGDRTMLDALIPFVTTLANRAERSGGETDMASRETVLSALTAAEQGAQATSTMLPRRGRSSYLGERALGHPDPGAIALTLWLRAAVIALFEQGRDLSALPGPGSSPAN